jgi:hypothetical protein
VPQFPICLLCFSFLLGCVLGHSLLSQSYPPGLGWVAWCVYVWNIPCLTLFHSSCVSHILHGIDSVLGTSVSTIHLLSLLPMFLISHFFCGSGLRIPLAQGAFYCSWMVRWHIGMLIPWSNIRLSEQVEGQYHLGEESVP